jgi:hypothetical protein
MPNLSQLSDEQLNQLAQARGIANDSQQSTNNLSNLSDEQLNQLAESRGISQPKQEQRIGSKLLNAAERGIENIPGQIASLGEAAYKFASEPEKAPTRLWRLR